MPGTANGEEPTWGLKEQAEYWMSTTETRFKRGQSGNPKGRPKGALNRATRAAQELLDGEAEALTRKCVEVALEGDTKALRLCLERIAPPRKERTVTFDLPEVVDVADVPTALASLIGAVATGVLTPGEGRSISDLLGQYRQAIEIAELEQRIVALEAMANATS
jgi:hypothetical protein